MTKEHQYFIIVLKQIVKLQFADDKKRQNVEK